MGLARTLGLCALAAGAAASGCAYDDPDSGPDPATVRQIQERIRELGTSRGKDFLVNIESLGFYLKPHSIPYLVDALGSDPVAKVRAGCAQALGRSQDGRAVEPLARAATDDGNAGVRYTAAYQLCTYRDPRGLPVLFEALRGDDPINRKLACDGLRAVTGLDFGYDPAGPAEQRAKAVERWEAWYRDLGPSGAAAQMMPPRPPPSTAPEAH
jgi:hypothetical protein